MAASGDDADSGGNSGTIVHWQERITLHYRLFPARGGSGLNGKRGKNGVYSFLSWICFCPFDRQGGARRMYAGKNGASVFRL